MREYTTEELNKMSQPMLVNLVELHQNQLKTISAQLSYLTEQIALMNQRAFGRKTETSETLENQLTIFEVFNEPELLCDDSKEPEITEITVSTHTRKKKSKREDNLEGLPARIFEHKLEDSKLAELFPHGYKELPCEIYKRLFIIPQTFMVDEHHVHIYASKNNDGTIIKADRPKDVFRNSVATPSLIAAIMAGKYLNHIPLERQSKLYEDYGVTLNTNTMANWMIKSSEIYFSILYDELHKHLYGMNVVHADESPFEVIVDGRSAGSKSQMWVYRNGACDNSKPIVLYDYRPTRCSNHPDEFLKGYSGTLVTDGYQAYHALENKRDDIKIAGCWVHAKRKFAEFVKASSNVPEIDSSIAAEATKRISKIFHLDNKLEEFSSDARTIARQQSVKPEVDAFFAWAKETIVKLPKQSETYKGLNYCINQEKYLRVFLDNGNVPMDNNRAEQAIRPFTLGRKNWVNVYSQSGAQASAILYSIIETTRANNLRTIDYLEFLLTELVNHQDDTSKDFIKDLMPWSETVQSKFRKPEKKQD